MGVIYSDSQYLPVCIHQYDAYRATSMAVGSHSSSHDPCSQFISVKSSPLQRCRADVTLNRCACQDTSNRPQNIPHLSPHA